MESTRIFLILALCCFTQILGQASRGEQNTRAGDFNNGFGETGQNQQTDTFTTRLPPSKKPTGTSTTFRPPQFQNRFGDRKAVTLSFDAEISLSMELFSLELLQHFLLRLESTNFMISPFSVYHMLVLLAEGAEGNTYNELNASLGLKSLSRTRDFQQYLNTALSQSTADVILRKFALLVTDVTRPISRDYETTIEQVYDAHEIAVSFVNPEAVANDINKLVSNFTQGQIQDTVRKEDLMKAQLVLLSGLYFQGNWMNIFNKSYTRQEPFHDTNGNKIGQVNMMFQRNALPYSAITELGCHVLELPYAEQSSSRNDRDKSGLSMILILPRKGLTLIDALEKVYSYGMENIYREMYKSKLEYGDEEVEVHIPRFDIETSLDLKETLGGLGIKDVFDQTHANLSKINRQYHVSSMVHKTKISVDERGTTAAAVTTSIFVDKITPPKFHANKPFLFFIVDKTTKLILFSGQYTTNLAKP